MEQQPAILKMEGTVQHYNWGGFDYIPELLRIPNSAQQPFAELWMGAHPSAPALVWQEQHKIPLDQLIRQDPPALLGTRVAQRFQGRLPYLLKVLDVRQMLSIQAHPSKQQAEAGFLRENELGIPLQAPHRNYKDDNHKPELMVALSDFWLLHGFKKQEEIARTLAQIPEWQPLLELFTANQQIRHLYQYIMELPQARVDELLQPLQSRLALQTPNNKNHPDFWAARAFEQYATSHGHCDRGIFSIYLFNLVRLQPGEGIFQASGIPHAYLKGINIELMANSDNVFRGGLTNKHVDVPELLQNLVFEAITPQVIQPNVTGDYVFTYPTPAPDFRLDKIVLPPGVTLELHPEDNPQILLLLEGSISLNGAPPAARGSIWLAPAHTHCNISASVKSTIFRASVP